MDKVHVIVNPFSARGNTGRRWDSLKEILKYHFKEFKYVFTEKPKQATQIARELLNDGFDLIIGVGGDGTLNEITNGFFQADSHHVVNEDAALGIVPSGTGSDFVRFLKIPHEFKHSVALIKDSGSRKIDVGKLTFESPGVSDPVRYFINVADFGLGAEVLRNISQIPAQERSALFYYKGLLSTIKTYNARKVRVVVDDNEEILDRFLIGAIANGRIFGGGMQVAPLAEPDDGFFDLVLVEDMKRFEIIRNSRHLYTGKLHKHPKVRVIRARNIKVYPVDDDPVYIEYDGEVGMSLPAQFQVMEKAVNFRV